MRTAIVRNKRGISLIEVIFSIFISGLAILTLNIFMTQMNLENKKLSDNSTTVRKNYDFLELMNNPTMWKSTVLDVTNYSFFACKLGLNPHPDQKTAVDCDKIDNKFRIIGLDKRVTYDQNESTAKGVVGFTADGEKCYGFDKENGNDACPIHYQITWDLPCLKAANCKEPMAAISVKQITKYKTKTALNSDKTYSLNVNLPTTKDLIPRDTSFLVDINSSEMQFDIINTDYAVDTFNLKVTSVKSSSLSSVSIKDNKIVYTPKADFYGVDKIYYTIEQSLFDKVSKADGVLWVKVMTPYTWVGDGEIDETNSFTNKKWYGIYNKKNWCGGVKNGKCTYFNTEGKKAFSYTLTDEEMKKASLVFNETCNNCNVILKGLPGSNGSRKAVTVNSIEMQEGFIGELKQVDDLNIEVVRNSNNRESKDPSLLYAFSQKGGTFIGANSKANVYTEEVYTEKKTLKIDSVASDLSGRSIDRPDGSYVFNGFGHLSIDGGKFYAPEAMNLITGYNWIGSPSYFFNQNGRITVYTRFGGGDFFDAPGAVLNEFAFNGNGSFEYNIIGSINVKDLIYYQNGFENQLRGLLGSTTGVINVSGNIYLHGSGGMMINGWAAWDYANVRVNGTGDQYIYSNMDLNGNKDRTKIGRLPILTIDKPDGILHIKGDLGLTSGIDYKNGTLKFYEDEERAAGDRQIIDYSSAWNTMFIRNTSGKELVLPNFQVSSSRSLLKIETDFRVAGDFILAKNGGYPLGPQTRKIYVEGDIYATSGINDYDDNGLITLEMTGTKNQRIIGTTSAFIKNNVSGLSAASLGGVDPTIVTKVGEATGYLPHVDISKEGGTVTIEGNVGFNQRLRVIKGSVSADNAHISFRNTNGYGYASIDLAGAPTKVLRMKGLSTWRGLDLAGSTIQITEGLNLPVSDSGPNNPTISNGTIELFGSLYYNNDYDKTSVDVNRAKIVFKGTDNQTIFATMTPALGRVGTFDFEVDKRNGDIVGSVNLNCQGYGASTFISESFNIINGNVNLNNCGMKVTKALTIVNHDYPASTSTETNPVDVENGRLNRGATPGSLSYGSLNNNGKVTPEVLAQK